MNNYFVSVLLPHISCTSSPLSLHCLFLSADLYFLPGLLQVTITWVGPHSSPLIPSSPSVFVITLRVLHVKWKLNYFSLHLKTLQLLPMPPAQSTKIEWHRQATRSWPWFAISGHLSSILCTTVAESNSWVTMYQILYRKHSLTESGQYFLYVIDVGNQRSDGFQHFVQDEADLGLELGSA